MIRYKPAYIRADQHMFTACLFSSHATIFSFPSQKSAQEAAHRKENRLSISSGLCRIAPAKNLFQKAANSQAIASILISHSSIPPICVPRRFDEGLRGRICMNVKHLCQRNDKKKIFSPLISNSTFLIGECILSPPSVRTSLDLLLVNRRHLDVC